MKKQFLNQPAIHSVKQIFDERLSIMLKSVFLLFILCFACCFVGCGYQPIAHQSKKALGEKIYVEVKIDTRDPQNSVSLKDELTRAIAQKLHANITDKEESDSIIIAQLKEVHFESLAENQVGFATFYRCNVRVEFQYENKNARKTRIFSKKGFYNFSLNESSVLTDSARIEAINVAVLRALDGFIAQVGIETL